MNKSVQYTCDRCGLGTEQPLGFVVSAAELNEIVRDVNWDSGQSSRDLAERLAKYLGFTDAKCAKCGVEIYKDLNDTYCQTCIENLEWERTH